MNRYSLKKDNQKCWLVAWSILPGFFFFFSPTSEAASDLTWREEKCTVRGLVDPDAETGDTQMYLYVEKRLIMAEGSYGTGRQKRWETGQICWRGIEKGRDRYNVKEENKIKWDKFSKRSSIYSYTYKWIYKQMNNDVKQIRTYIYIYFT